MKVEVCGKNETHRPVAVGVLEREKAPAEAFDRNACPRGIPDVGRYTHEVALDLPAQCRIEVQ